MSIIFSILMSFGFIATPYQSDVKHQDATKFDSAYSTTTRGGLEWDESH